MKNTNPILRLSKRENEIFLMLLSGVRTKAIADQLNLKSNTISTVIKNLKLKTGAKKYGYAVQAEKVTSYNIKLMELGYSYSHGFEISRGKRMQFIRFEYWTKLNSLFLAEIVNGECTSFFAEQTPG